MLTFKSCDIFRCGVKCLVNPVNCVGVMGAGLALQFKRRYPEMFEAYRKDCLAGKVRPGKLIQYGNVINFPTKRHWRDRSRLSDVELGLRTLSAAIERRSQVKRVSVAIPPLGCGLGGLEWEEVYKLMVHYLLGLDADIIVTRNAP